MGSMPEWLKGADCKSAGLPTLVQIQLGLLYLNIRLKLEMIIPNLNQSMTLAS